MSNSDTPLSLMSGGMDMLLNVLKFVPLRDIDIIVRVNPLIDTAFRRYVSSGHYLEDVTGGVKSKSNEVLLLLYKYGFISSVPDAVCRMARQIYKTVEYCHFHMEGNIGPNVVFRYSLRDRPSDTERAIMRSSYLGKTDIHSLLMTGTMNLSQLTPEERDEYYSDRQNVIDLITLMPQAYRYLPGHLSNDREIFLLSLSHPHTDFDLSNTNLLLAWVCHFIQ